jgi:hypothetical protein
LVRLASANCELVLELCAASVDVFLLAAIG